MITERIYDADDDEIDALLAGDDVKKSVVLYNSDGEKLVYAGSNVWVPESAIMTEEEEERFRNRYSHPSISAAKTALQLMIPPIVTAAVLIFLRFVAGAYAEWLSDPGRLILLGAGALLIYSLLRAKSIIIFWVQVYQVKAPMEVRERCAMTPTCSDYMILAVRKYGALRGVIKGIGRLRRCDGTRCEDWP